MLNVVNSPLQERFEFLRFTLARPQKKNVADNYGYGSLWKGGIKRILSGAIITLWHLILFPYFLVRQKADVVQVQSSDFQSFWEAAMYILICKALRYPTVMRIGGAFDHFYMVSSPRAQRLIRAVLRSPDRLIVQSGFWCDLVRSLGRTDGIVVLPNWVPDNLAESVIRPRRETPICLYIAGTEAVRKGVDEFVEAMRIIKSVGAKVRFRLVAMPPHLIERLKRENMDVLSDTEGYVDHGQLLSIMREADIFVLPSRGEGFPNSLIEAMACGMACISTPVGAVPEIVGADGAIVIPVRDAAAIATAIISLAEDIRLRGRIAAAGHGIVRERYVASAVLPMLEGAWISLSR